MLLDREIKVKQKQKDCLSKTHPPTHTLKNKQANCHTKRAPLKRHLPERRRLRVADLGVAGGGSTCEPAAIEERKVEK